MIAHDIKNLIVGIKTNLDLALDQGVSSDVAKTNISAASDFANELFTLISDYMAIQKMANGELIPHLEDTHLNVVVARAIDQMNLVAKKAAVSLTSLSGEEPLYARADRSLLLRVLINVILSAIKYTTPGGDIGIGIEPEGKKVSIRVEYTGQCIPQEYAQSIFEQFPELNLKAVNVHKANGLALHFCKAAIELMGGEIRVEPEESNSGSQFIFTIPQAEPVL